MRSIPPRTRLALTGTPVENHLAELWSIMEFCNPGLLGPAKRFRQRYRAPIERARRRGRATAALKRATGPFMLRRLKTDKTIISDLPEKLEMKVWCNAHRRAGQPVPGRGQRHAGQDRRQRGHRAARQRCWPRWPG